MEKYYECKRCFYKCVKICDMKNHLNRKKICNRILESYKYNEDDIYNLSLKQNIISNNKYNCNNDYDNNKLYKCDLCKMRFTTSGNLKRHINISCKGNKKEILNNNLDNNLDNNSNNIINSNNNSNNNNSNNNNSNNIINSNNNSNNVININFINSFDKKWSTEHIDINDKYELLKSKFIYTNTLRKILENLLNLNVLVDNKSDESYYYKNNNIEKTETKTLLRRIMGKLNNTINDLGDDIKNSNIKYDEDILDESLDKNNQKFNDYRMNKNNIQNSYNNYIANIYNEKNKETHDTFKYLSLKHNLNYDDTEEGF